jgi:hypothetical protein
LGRTCPYIPTVRSVRGWVASSSRSPSTYGQSSADPKKLRLVPGICSGSTRVWNSTYFAAPVGSTRLRRAERGYPIHGMTIDHPSTQRSAYTRSSRGARRTISSMSNVLGLWQSPPTSTDHGRGRRVWALSAGSDLSVPNS